LGIIIIWWGIIVTVCHSIKFLVIY